MVQAARSGRQNIAEGSVASGTSKKMEIKLTNVANASLEELLLDYEDFLRQHGLRQWDKEDSEAMAVRNQYRSYPTEWFNEDRPEAEILAPYEVAKATAESAANTILCLTHQAIYLLKRQARLAREDLPRRRWLHRTALSQASCRAAAEAGALEVRR